jgi:hypothetical protein
MEVEEAGHVIWGYAKCIQNLIKKLKEDKTTWDS